MAILEITNMSTNPRGPELKALSEKLGISGVEICAEAKISTTTLWRLFMDKPERPPLLSTRKRVVEAIDRLRTRSKAG